MEKNTKEKVTKKSTSKTSSNKKKIIIEEPKEEIKKEIKKEDKKIDWSKKFDSVDENRKVVYGFVIGLLLGLLILVISWPDRIAQLKNGEEPVVEFGKTTITANNLYDEMKNQFSVTKLVDMIDDNILSKKYPTNDEMEKSVEETYNSYINYYTSSGEYTEEQVISGMGFKDKDSLMKSLQLEYRRNLYLDDYVEDSITDDEIKAYYNDNVFGDIDSKHILVKVANSNEEGKTEEEAKDLAEEIIAKLDDGKSFDDVKDEYKDSVTYEELGYQAFNAELEAAYMTALKELKNDEYSKEPVQTSYGFHIIYRIDQKDKAKLKDVKSEIIDVIAKNKKAADSNLLYKALVELRESKNLNFSDSELKKKYEVYCSQIKKS